MNTVWGQNILFDSHVARMGSKNIVFEYFEILNEANMKCEKNDGILRCFRLSWGRTSAISWHLSAARKFKLDPVDVI